MSSRAERLSQRNANKLLLASRISSESQIAELRAQLATSVAANDGHANVVDTLTKNYAILRNLDKEVINTVKIRADAYEKAIKETYEPLLLRLYQLERLVLHRSLDLPPLVGYRLPQQTWKMQGTMHDLIYDLREAGDERLKVLEDLIYTEEGRDEDRDWSVDAWVDGVPIPHPEPPIHEHRRSPSPRRKRSRSPPLVKAEGSSTDSGSQGFEIVPAGRAVATCVKLEEVGYPSD